MMGVAGSGAHLQARQRQRTVVVDAAPRAARHADVVSAGSGVGMVRPDGPDALL